MAPQNMNLSQARVIDPILTTQMRGYSNAALVYQALFPIADVPARAAKVIKFDQRAFRLQNTKRAPGTDTRAITVGYDAEPIAMAQDALDAIVPRELEEESAAVPGINVATAAIQLVLDVVDLGHEKACADIALNPANYAAAAKDGLSGTDKWSDPTADVFSQINDAKTGMAKRIGRKPNTMVVSSDELNALRANQHIKDQYKYTSADSITEEMIARYLQIERLIVGDAVYIADGAADGEGQFIWGGGRAVLACVDQNASTDRAGLHLKPSFGWTYRRNGYPIVETPYWNRSKKSWVYGVTQERQAVAAMPDAGHLFYNVL